MDVSGLLHGAGAWLAPAATLAAAGLIAAVLRLRNGLRLDQHLLAREAEIERLQDQVWRLSEREERMRGLVEAQLDVIVRRDRDGRITFANEGFAALVGEPREALLGASPALKVVETSLPELRPDGARAIDEAIATPAGLRWIAWIETSVTAGRDGAPPETLRAGRDVTARVVTERALHDARAKAEAASEAKSRFLATVSHEFRTPLNGILGMAELVLDTRLNPEQTTYVRAIKTSGEALLSLIDEILDFSKIEAGRIDLSAEPFDLRQLVEGVVELLAPKAQGKGIEIAASLSPGVPRMAMGDADRLRQVLVNLAGNAVKFTDVGGVGLAVERGATGQIVLSISDTGPGIDMDRLPALFQEFEQGDGSASRRHGGTGLGLAITRRIVERMQGGIAVESTVGRGTTFKVTLPLPDADSTARPHAPAAADALAGKQVVLLARSPFEAPFLARRLREAGAEVTLTETPVDALAKFAVGTCDVFLADCALGSDVVRAVAQEARAAGVGRSIVLLSPFDRRDFGPPAAAGFDTYLVKPVRPRSLFERLTGATGSDARLAASRVGEDEHRPKPAETGGPRRKAKRGPTARVLLAEDNEINALLALKSLEKLGAIVDWAKDGREALALAEASFSGVRQPYDIVLMDIRMPGLDGLEATRRIRTLEDLLGRRERTRIIALTANALREDQAAAERAGFDGFLAKPFEFQALTALLATAKAPLAEAS